MCGLDFARKDFCIALILNGLIFKILHLMNSTCSLVEVQFNRINCMQTKRFCSSSPSLRDQNRFTVSYCVLKIFLVKYYYCHATMEPWRI